MIGVYGHYGYTQASVTAVGNLFQVAYGANDVIAVAKLVVSFTGLLSPNKVLSVGFHTGSSTDVAGTELTTPGLNPNVTDPSTVVVDSWTTQALTGGSVVFYDYGNEASGVWYAPKEDEKFIIKANGSAGKLHIRLLDAPSASCTVNATLVLEMI